MSFDRFTILVRFIVARIVQRGTYALFYHPLPVKIGDAQKRGTFMKKNVYIYILLFSFATRQVTYTDYTVERTSKEPEHVTLPSRKLRGLPRHSNNLVPIAPPLTFMR